MALAVYIETAIMGRRSRSFLPEEVGSMRLPLIVEQAGAMFDQQTDRSAKAIVPKVFQFVEGHYAVDKSVNIPAGFVMGRGRKKISRGEIYAAEFQACCSADYLSAKAV